MNQAAAMRRQNHTTSSTSQYRVKMNTSAYLFANVSISGESTNHHHDQISLFTNNALCLKQLVKDERRISTFTSIR